METPDSSSPDSSVDFAELQSFQSKSRSKVLIVGALGLLLVGGGIVYASHSAAQAASAESMAAAAALRKCLFGGPLAAEENSVMRFRRLQLRSMSLSDADAELKRDQVWPLACKDEALEMKRVFSEAKDTTSAEAMGKLVQFVGDIASRHNDPTSVVSAAVSVLDAAVPGEVPQGDEPLPEQVRSADTLAKTPPVSKHGTALSKSYTEDNSGISLPVLVTEESLAAPVLCTFTSESATCEDLTELAKVKGHGLRLLGTSDASSKTLIFAGRRGSEGVFVAGEKEPIAKLYSYGGYASANGHAAVLGWDESSREMRLVRREGAEEPESTTLKPNFRIGNYFYNAGLLWDQVLVRGVTPDNQRRLFTLPLRGSGGPSSESGGDDFSLADIGELTEPGWIRAGEEEQTHITGCRTEKATVVRVRGRDNDFITFRLNDAFTMPVYGPTWGVLGCHGTTATLTTAAYAKTGTKIYHSACTSAGCSTRDFPPTALDHGTMALRPIDEHDVQAVDLAGRVLVVWKAGERGGLRMKMAKPDLFENAAEQVLFDDLLEKSKLSDMSTILGFRLYSRETFGVLLLSTMAGLHAFKISPDGAVEPFDVKSAG